MPFSSKAQQRFMFARHPRIAKRWAKEHKKEHTSIKSLPEKLAYDNNQTANYWQDKSETRRLEGGAPTPMRTDIVPKKGFGTMYGAGSGKKKRKVEKTAFVSAFKDEISKTAASLPRWIAARLARQAAPLKAKRIRGVRRRIRSLRKGRRR